MARGCVPKYSLTVTTDDMVVVDTLENVSPEVDYPIKVKSGRNTAFVFKVSSELDELSQIPITAKVDSSTFSFTINGTKGKEIEVTRFVKTEWWNENDHRIKISYSNAVKINCVSIKQKN